MKFRRGLFVGALFVLFVCCFNIMNEHYDELSRYQYANDVNRDVIIEYMSKEEINYLIDRQYQPNEFIGYIKVDGFSIYRVDWYNYAKSNSDLHNSEIVAIVNQFSEIMTLSEFKQYCKNYSMEQLYSFYFEDNSFIKGLSLISNLNEIEDKIDNTTTLFTYEPKDLVQIKDVPVINQNVGKDSILLRQTAAEQLSSMCKFAYDLNDKTCGNMIVTEGYVSFDEQEIRYEDALLIYGPDDVDQYVSYPGQSIYQLGTVVKMIPVGFEIEVDDSDETDKDETDIDETDKNESNENISNKNDDEDESENKKETKMSVQQIWLKEHANEYGFIFLNDSDEPLTEFILKYVGNVDEESSE